MGALTHITEAPLDSTRLGIRVMRGTIEATSDNARVINEIVTSNADLVIFRVPAGASDVATSLQRQGYVVIHADTLVYYRIDLSKSTSPQPEPQVQRATETHRKAIALIAEHGFSNYRAHYAANPLIPKDLILSGYVEWALSRLQDDHNGSATWVVSDDDTVAGFATCDTNADSVEIVLNAVDPEFERRGLYGKLLRHIQHHYAHELRKELVISTQIWNYAVQRQWIRAGLRPYKAYDTYHLDRRLSPKQSPQ